MLVNRGDDRVDINIKQNFRTLAKKLKGRNSTLMDTDNEIKARNKEAAWIVHWAAIATAIAAAAFAQSAWFGFATAFLTPITVWMIISIGSLFGKKYEESALWSVFGVACGAAGAIVLARAFFGLFPLAEDLANAGIAVCVTEALGWGAYTVFRGEKHVPKAEEERKSQPSPPRARARSVHGQRVSLRG
jgi:uncharacterized protein (DUF697 family)